MTNNKKMEEFFDAKDDFTDEDTENIINGEIVLDSQENNTPSTISSSDLALVSPEEVRDNYDIAVEALKMNLVIQSNVMEKALDHTPDAAKLTRYLEGISTLMKTSNETAKLLAGIHQDAGSILGNTKGDINIDNSQVVVNASADILQDIAVMARDAVRKGTVEEGEDKDE